MRILLVDNNITPVASPHQDMSYTIRRYLDGEVVVRRGPEADFPLSPEGFTHVILSGSKTSCMDPSPWVEKQLELIRKTASVGVPMLGVCFGHQLIARAFGGPTKVHASPTPEIGWTEVELFANNPITQSLPQRFYTYSSHFEEVAELPPHFVPTARSNRCAIQAYYVEAKPIFGIQFHPEYKADEGEQRMKLTAKKLQEEFRGNKLKEKLESFLNKGKGHALHSENVALTIFKNFLTNHKSS